MFYTIYKVTNLIDDKIYIGMHKTKDLNDGYMGSGKYLKRAIKKYGIENFKKEILFIFDNENEMISKEKELIAEEFISCENTYNLCPGGKGGFGYINSNESIREKTYEKIRGVKNPNKGGGRKRPWLSESHRMRHELGLVKIPTFSGRSHSEETKKKMSDAKKGKFLGKWNSQYGTMWINNGSENRKIKKDIDTLPQGWYKGRI